MGVGRWLKEGGRAWPGSGSSLGQDPLAGFAQVPSPPRDDGSSICRMGRALASPALATVASWLDLHI